MFILFHSAALIFFLFFFGIFIIFSLHISAGTYFEVPFEHFAEVFSIIKTSHFSSLIGGQLVSIESGGYNLPEPDLLVL